MEPSTDGPRNELVLTPAERMLWGVGYQDGVLRLRTTGWRQVLGGVHLLVFGVFVPWAAFADHWNSVQLVLGAVWLAATLLLYLQMWVGTVVVEPDGLTVRWFVARRFSWERVDYLQVVEKRPYWGDMGTWFAVDVIDLALRDGRHVTLWPTRSSNHGPGGGDDPSAASLKLHLLMRYRDALAPRV
ncbi:MAG TPA: hypothetical protein VIK61_20620 [Acidimicrobiia bacterium]